MIYGRIGVGPGPPTAREMLAPFHRARPVPLPGRRPPGDTPREAVFGRVAFGYLPDGVPSLDGTAGLAADSHGMAVAQGFLANRAALARALGGAGGPPPAPDARLPELVLAAVRAFGGDGAAERMEGTVAFAACPSPAGPVWVSRDRLGVEPLFVAEHQGEVLFCSRAAGVADAGPGRALDGDALREYLLLGYLVGERSLLRGVRRLPGGHGLVVESGGVRPLAWWDPRPGASPASREAAVEALRDLLEQVVVERAAGAGRVGVFLSGGLDSSTVTALLARRPGSAPPVTFSFRCRGESYDESGYAGIVARAFGTDHHLAEYPPERVADAPVMIAGMDEPFSDIGINVATWILAGEAAAAGVGLILTGDGGDELFCGHPVYAAQRLARRLALVPAPLLGPLTRPFTWLPDSEAKKDLRVKLKRFAMGLQHPADLGPSRWRFQTSPAGVEHLLAAGAPQAATGDPYAGVRRAMGGTAAGLDPDGREVLADYRIVVEFYLRRLVLARRFGLEVRVPLLDRRLVELAAALPAAWRVDGLKDEKVLMKPVVEPWLPREVVHRPDKLGHSVPFKNWLRHDPVVRGVVEDALGPKGLAGRGLVRPEVVARLRAEHDSGRENRSHRLWGMAVLELWLRGNLDR